MALSIFGWNCGKRTLQSFGWCNCFPNDLYFQPLSATFIFIHDQVTRFFLLQDISGACQVAKIRPENLRIDYRPFGNCQWNAGTFTDDVVVVRQSNTAPENPPWDIDLWMIIDVAPTKNRGISMDFPLPCLPRGYSLHWIDPCQTPVLRLSVCRRAPVES